MINPVLKQILTSKTVTDEFGNSYKLVSEIGPDKGEFIRALIQSNEVRHSIEIGCAFGVSSLYICDALSQKESPRHVIIDPYQSTRWHGVGINNLKTAGFSFSELIEKPSEIALPTLLQSGECFDFAFIDGYHTFDHALLDFFYLNRLLKVQGIVVFDDVNWPSVNKVLRYVTNYPCYKVVGSIPAKQSRMRRSMNAIKTALSFMTRPFPKFFMQELFDDSVLRPALNADMIALRKVDADNRESNWYVPF